MQGEIANWHKGEQVIFPSASFMLKMDPRRPIVLSVVSAIIIVIGIFLVVWTSKMHRKMAIPIMRNATLSEVKSSQTKDVLEPVI